MEGTGRLKVLHVSQATTAGVPNVILSLVSDQVARGWDVVVACPVDGYLADRSRVLGAEVARWDALRQPGPSVLKESVRFRTLLREVKPDLVHLHSAKAGLVGRLVTRGRVPTLFQPHAWSFHAVEGVTRRATESWERWATRWSDVVIAVSEDERLEGLNVGVRGAFAIVPNGVDVAPVRGGGRARARARLGIADVPTVVCAGRLCRQKGQDLLLSAWQSVMRDVPSAHLILVGDGPDRRTLQEAASRMTTVHLVGERDDVGLWLAAADVVALPSRWEAGLSLVAMESMAAGRSVVATEVAGVRSGIDAGAGAIVPQNDLPALSAAIVERLLSPDLATSEGMKGRQVIEQHFDRTRSAALVSDLYGEVLRRRGVKVVSGGSGHARR